MSDSEPIPSPQQNEDETSTVKKPSLIWAIVISLVIFVLLLVFPIEAFFVIPKFKTIFADILGPGETLPEFTLLILQISDAFKNNLIITVPVYFIFSLICAEIEKQTGIIGAVENTDWPKGTHEIDKRNFIGSSERLQSLSGWSPSISLEEYMKFLVNHYAKEYINDSVS